MSIIISDEAEELIEQPTEHGKLKMIGLTRSSSQEVAEGYGPSIQKSELAADAQSQCYQLLCIRDIVEPATINLEERELFNEVLADAIRLKKENRCDGLSFSRCDRLSRRFDTAIQIALDCKKHGLALRFVREGQWLCPDDEPMQFIVFILNAFGVHTQTNISIARSEEDVLSGQLERLEEFSGEPSPPDKATFEKLTAYWRGDLVGELDHVSDELKAKFAEFFDLYIIVHPKESSKGYSFNITANIPLEIEDNTVTAYDMVFTPSRGGYRGRG
jgi:hypothetical protein